MAALHSTRAAANLSRPLPQPHRPDSPSSLSVFLTNLRLLDLDLLPDWPEISPMTFATSGAGVQGQKRRVQCVEWALFRLFSLWDPQEAANVRTLVVLLPSFAADAPVLQKLKPFFPPLDQMQSLNLRAALLRALENAKKTGVLGRDSVIRKTMLDECKGERLEEVLAYFSTAVLKRAVARDAHRGGRHPSLAAKLVMEERGYQGNNAELIALVAAHRSSLRQFLERKDVARTRYGDFARLLNIKERALARRSEMVHDLEQQGGGVTVSETARAEMCRTVQTNWSGNERWMNALVGDPGSSSGRGLLSEPFDTVWLRVQQGTIMELEESGGDLLDQLDSRVRVQRERLKEWDAFRVKAFHHKPGQPPSSPATHAETNPARGLDLKFVHHQDLQVGRSQAHAPSLDRGNQPLEEYAGIVDELQHQLTQIRSRRMVPCRLLSGPRARSSDADDQDAVSEISDLGPPSAGPDVPRRLPNETENASIERFELPPKDITTAQLYDHDTQVLDPAGRKILWEPSSPNQSPRPSAVRQAAFHEPESSMESRHAPTPTQQLADHVLELMNSVSPSPNKHDKPRHTLSLAQRTRLSMARTDNLFLEGEEPESPLEPVAVDKAMARPGLSVVDSSALADHDAPKDLASRTRRSMAGFEKAKHKAQLERRRSQRKSRAPPRKESSLFPTVEEEWGPEAGNPVCEEDMEAVFRSRPRIKASPIPSPTRDLSQDSRA